MLVIPTLKVKEEMSLTIHTLEEALKETRKERDKTLHQLDRLKQHLLDKVLLFLLLIIFSFPRTYFELFLIILIITAAVANPYLLLPSAIFL